MAQLPVGSAVVVNVARPVASSVPVPSGVPPLLKTTVSPARSSGRTLVTVAVKVTGCPATTVDALEDTLVTVGTIKRWTSIPLVDLRNNQRASSLTTKASPPKTGFAGGASATGNEATCP